MNLWMDAGIAKTILISCDFLRDQALIGEALFFTAFCCHLCSFLLFKVITFLLHHKACWILVPWPGVRLVPSAVEAQSLNHWTTRNVPSPSFHLATLFHLLGRYLCLQSLQISGYPPQSSLCMLHVLTGNSPSCGCSQTHLCTLHCPRGLHLADLCLQRIYVLIPHQAPAAQHVRSDSAPSAVTDLTVQPPALLLSSETCNLCPRYMPRALSASSSSSPSLQRWACKTADISFHTPLSSSLSCFHPIPFFFPDFQILAVIPQHFRMKFLNSYDALNFFKSHEEKKNKSHEMVI